MVVNGYVGSSDIGTVTAYRDWNEKGSKKVDKWGYVPTDQKICAEAQKTIKASKKDCSAGAVMETVVIVDKGSDTTEAACPGNPAWTPSDITSTITKVKAKKKTCKKGSTLCDVGEETCTSDSCVSGLACATGKDSKGTSIVEQAIPGLYGYADSYHINKAYCYNPNYRKLPEVVNKGKNGVGCTSAAPCAAGEGGCKADTDCNTGLKCYVMASKMPHTIPGFHFSSTTITGEYNFCYDPKWIQSHRMMASAPSGKCADAAVSTTQDGKSCGVGEGPCTKDTNCD